MNFSILFQILKKLDQGEYCMEQRCCVLEDRLAGIHFQLRFCSGLMQMDLGCRNGTAPAPGVSLSPSPGTACQIDHCLFPSGEPRMASVCFDGLQLMITLFF